MDDRTEPETPEQLIAEGLDIDPSYTTPTIAEGDWTGDLVAQGFQPGPRAGIGSSTFTIANRDPQNPRCERHRMWHVVNDEAPNTVVPDCLRSATKRVFPWSTKPRGAVLIFRRAETALAAAQQAGPNWVAREVPAFSVKTCPWCVAEFSLEHYEVVE